MLVNIPYGKEIIRLKVNESNVAGILECNNVSVSDEKNEIRIAIENPLRSKNLRSFLENAKNVLIVVNDATRPTPTTTILETIYKIIKPFHPKFVIATGTHHIPAEKEYRKIFGDLYTEFQPCIYAHKAKDENCMAYIGKTSYGTEVHVNKLVLEADRIIVLGSVEPHYFAGYTGGRKFLLPGLAVYKSVEQNHRLAMSQKADTFILEGNPVHEDMIEALRLLPDKEIFAIMMVLNRDHRIYAVTSGDIEASFLAAIPRAQEVFAVKISGKSDIVLSVAKHPTDINLYQSQKALENGKLALKNKGILILVSECHQGIGDESFVACLSGSNSPERALQNIQQEYKFGYHKAARIASTRLWCDIYSVTSLPDTIIRSLFMRPFHTVQEAVDSALKIKGKQAKVLILLDGAMTVPVLS